MIKCWRLERRHYGCCGNICQGQQIVWNSLQIGGGGRDHFSWVIGFFSSSIHSSSSQCVLVHNIRSVGSTMVLISFWRRSVRWPTDWTYLLVPWFTPFFMFLSSRKLMGLHRLWLHFHRWKVREVHCSFRKLYCSTNWLNAITGLLSRC